MSIAMRRILFEIEVSQTTPPAQSLCGLRCDGFWWSWRCRLGELDYRRDMVRIKYFRINLIRFFLSFSCNEMVFGVLETVMEIHLLRVN